MTNFLTKAKNIKAVGLGVTIVSALIAGALADGLFGFLVVLGLLGFVVMTSAGEIATAIAGAAEKRDAKE